MRARLVRIYDLASMICGTVGDADVDWTRLADATEKLAALMREQAEAERRTTTAS